MKNRGFTLLELMITVLVVGVLSTIALSSYRSYTLRANRVDGTGMLLKIAVAEEKYFLQNSTYATDLVSAPPTGLGLGSTSPAGLYNLTVAAGSTGAIGTSFTAGDGDGLASQRHRGVPDPDHQRSGAAHADRRLRLLALINPRRGRRSRRTSTKRASRRRGSAARDR